MLNNSLPLLSSIYSDSELIIAAEPAKKIGLWFDNTLSKSEQVNSIYKTAFCYLHNLATVRKFLSHKNFEMLLCNFSNRLLIVILYLLADCKSYNTYKMP